MLKKAFMAGALAGLTSLGAQVALADFEERPIYGVCTQGEQVVEFTGVSTGGMTEIFMSLQSWDKMIEPNMERIEYADLDGNGFINAAIGQLSFEVYTDPARNFGILRSTDGNFNNAFQNAPGGNNYIGWDCDF